MKLAYFGYRTWAENILERLVSEDILLESYTIKNSEYQKNINSQIIKPNELDIGKFNDYNGLFFYGWSWMVPQELVDTNLCVCLHPSKLPLYRGGSPIQHQIINGEEESAVSLFKMGDGLDNGPLLYQKPFSLEGSLEDIFTRISDTGSELTLRLIEDIWGDTVHYYSQDESEATTYRRRKPAQSELLASDIPNMNYTQIHNFIRALQPPYPQAYVMRNGEKQYLTGSKEEIQDLLATYK